MVIARMPEDRSEIFENHTKTFEAIHTCMRTPVGPSDPFMFVVMCYIVVAQTLRADEDFQQKQRIRFRERDVPTNTMLIDK
eukprot:10934219-Heterocapsa_arctica.AAC.1